MLKEKCKTRSTHEFKWNCGGTRTRSIIKAISSECIWLTGINDKESSVSVKCPCFVRLGCMCAVLIGIIASVYINLIWMNITSLILCVVFFSFSLFHLRPFQLNTFCVCVFLHFSINVLHHSFLLLQVYLCEENNWSKANVRECSVEREKNKQIFCWN